MDKPVAHTGRADARMLRRREVADLWLKGYRQSEIAVSMDLSLSQVSGDIRAFRNELYRDSQATLQEHAEQTVAILRKVLARLWWEYSQAVKEGIRLKALEQIRKTEESIAKVRGLLSSKVIGDVFLNVKMYDFSDTLPDPPKALGEGGRIIEGTGVIVEEKLTPDPPPPSEEVPDYLRPEYDTGHIGFRAPNGAWVDLSKAITNDKP